MAQAIGQMLPGAVGVAVSPLSIAAVVLMLVTPRGRVNGPVFVLGWWIGLAVLGAIALSIAGAANASENGTPATWVDAVKLLLGVGLLLIAVRQWGRRPHGSGQAATPKWMGALDTFTPVKAGAAGVFLSGLNPKNLVLGIGAAVEIAQTGISTGQEVATWVIFVAIASIGVTAPIVIYFAMGNRSGPLLDRVKNWMVQNNATILAALLLILGVKLIGDAISGFST